MTQQEEKSSIMIFQSQDGEKRMELNTGLSETLGDHIGEKMEISDLLEESIILVSSPHAHGLLPETLGPMTKETRLNFLKRIDLKKIN